MKLRNNIPIVARLKKRNIPVVTHLKTPSVIIVVTLGSYIVKSMVEWKFNLNYLWFGCCLIPLFHVTTRYPSVARKMLLWLAVDLIAFINITVNGSHNPAVVGGLFAAQCWGAFLYCERKDLFPIEQIAAAFILYLLYKVISTPQTFASYGADGVALYAIVLTGSVGQNTVSIFLCEFLSYSIFYRYYKGKNIGYPLFALSCVVAKICSGMGGILSTLSFLAGFFLIDKKRNAVDWERVLLLSALIALAFALFMDFGETFRQVTDDNGRLYIWSHYIGCIDSLRDLIFGADVSNVPFLVFANNMHNTFMNYHFCFGLIPFVFFMWRHFTDFAYCIRKRNHLLLLVMCITTLRALTDETDFAFGGIWTAIWLMAQTNEGKPKPSILPLRGTG